MNNTSKAYLALSSIAIIWGASFGINRMATAVLHPLLFVFLRFGLALPLLFMVLKITEGSVAIAYHDMFVLALVGFFGVTVMENAVIYSIQYTSLANASLLNTAPWPIFTALFAPFFTKEKVTRRLVAGGGLALAGVCLIILGGGQSGALPPGHVRGDLLALLVSLLGALYNLGCMPLMKRYSPLRVSTWFIFFGVLFMAPMTYNLWNTVGWSTLGTAVWGAVLYNVVLCTVVAFVVWNWGMKTVGAARANFLRYLVPGVAVAAGFVMYREVVAIWQVLGGLLMLAGLLWISSEKTSIENKEDSPPCSSFKSIG